MLINGNTVDLTYFLLRRNRYASKYGMRVLWQMNTPQYTWVICFFIVYRLQCSQCSEGRPVCIGEDDYDTLLPDEAQEEEDSPWRPANCDPKQIDHIPVPGRILSCFKAAASLCEHRFPRGQI